MKILLINSFCGSGSTGRICTDIYDILTGQGHEVRIAYGRNTSPEKYRKDSYRIGTDLDVKLHGLKARMFDKVGFGSVKATKKFIEWVREYDPDVIHLHNIHGYYMNIEILFDYLKSCGKRILWTLHDCWAFTGHSAYCDAAGCTKWKNGCGNCPNLKEYPIAYTDDSSNNWRRKKEIMTGVPDMTIITPSKWLAELVKDSYLGEYNVEVINNGIDTDVFKPTYGDFRERYHLEEKKILLGVASVWEKRKGLDDFIKLSEMIDDSYRIVLVGLSDNQLKTLPEGIIGITRTNSVKELAEIYTAADLFLNLTYEDNYPTVNLEAQSCGTPVITYDTGGSGESVPESNKIEKGNLKEVVKRLELTDMSICEPCSKNVSYGKVAELYNM
ncbi:glycosyltransferase [uncultured Ruminococcus sp.]|uniref:glycosyltransferase n=1 Tax=uncultured Ruminococcus sp. TaxID=165186 RepID=UPI0025D37B9E|nr:glycosyltransferase [uncultured Ruminococcus sp.]